MPTDITTQLAMLLAYRGEPRATPTFLAMANGQIKGVLVEIIDEYRCVIQDMVGN